MLPKGSICGRSSPSPILTVKPYIPLTSLPNPWISPVRESCSPVSFKSPSFSTRSPRPLRIPPSPSSKPPSFAFSLRFLIMCLRSFDLNAVLLHLGVKGLVIHLKETRGLGFVAARFPQDGNEI